jgi:hypothetical protein
VLPWVFEWGRRPQPKAKGSPKPKKDKRYHGQSGVDEPRDTRHSLHADVD